jgi:hypothetical protein
MTELGFSAELSDLIRKGDVDGVSMFVRQNPETLDLETPFGSWLDFAAKKGQLDVVRLLVSLGLNVNRVNHHNERPIVCAASGGNPNIVAFLLANGARVELLDRDPVSNPLFGAIDSKSAEVARILLEHGADATVDYGNGKTVVAHALMFGAREIAEVVATHLAGGNTQEAKRIIEASTAVVQRQDKPKRARILPTLSDLKRK